MGRLGPRGGGEGDGWDWLQDRAPGSWKRGNSRRAQALGRDEGPLVMSRHQQGGSGKTPHDFAWGWWAFEISN